ncbi:MAG: Fic family protein [Candidatus Symbiothrix sp.]|jgi:Fic family protein|nr:Fic family protein [Candidatus Symbiothrix sp.]
MISVNKIWDTIEAEQQRYNNLELNEMKDYKKFYIYSIIAHSTAIEGSTLTEKDTLLLFDEGIVVKGKSIFEHLMNLDLKGAYEYAVSEAREKTKITPDFLKQLNSLVMKNTGGIHNMAIGTFDSSKGDYRLCGVTAGIGGKSYMDYKKVPDNVIRLCEEINKRLDSKSLKEAYNLSFDAHFNLATIHPWVDGNGRTSRLLMNYIQFYQNIVPTKIYKEDKGEYIKALEESRETKTTAPFRIFMANQHLKTLHRAINNYKKGQKQANGLALLF